MEDNEAKYISLSKAAEMTEYSQEYISLLCRTKKMKGVKFGRNWVTTAQWVNEYVDKTNGKKEMRIPVRIEKDKKKKSIPKKRSFISYKPYFLTFSEVAVFTVFFGLMIAAFAFFQEMLILTVLR